jgi:hypothetical protein
MTVEAAMAHLIEYRGAQARPYAPAHEPFYAEAKDRLRQVEYALKLAQAQGGIMDGLRRRLLSEALTYRTSLTEALTASAAPLVTTEISSAISAANVLIAALDTPTVFANLPPDFEELIP